MEKEGKDMTLKVATYIITFFVGMAAITMAGESNTQDKILEALHSVDKSSGIMTKTVETIERDVKEMREENKKQNERLLDLEREAKKDGN